MGTRQYTKSYSLSIPFVLLAWGPDFGVTHMRKEPERVKEYRAGSLRFLPGFFLSVLHDLLHKAAHGGCCLVLLLPCGVGVGAEGKPGIVVPQHGGHRLYVYAVLEGCGGEGVPQVVEADVGQSCVL